MTCMRIHLTLIFVVSLFFGGIHGALASAPEQASSSTADHSGFEELKQDFLSGPEVTKACLGCHNQAGKQLHATTHWTWQFSNKKTGQLLGKKNVVNNAFMSVSSNEPFCTRCHIGYDWKDEKFDFAAEEQVDCLACHDTTGTYALKRMHLRRAKCSSCHVEYDKSRAREFVRKPDYSVLALKVGKTSRNTCGACHFRSDGGDGVKHGDLDTSLLEASRELDVHMNKGGLDFTCSTCHETEEHQIPGSRYVPENKDVRGMDVIGGSRATCESCHGLQPHPEGSNAKLNDHVDRVACQTCHIPAFARGGLPTKTYWDWSTAGRMNDAGKQTFEKDALGRIIYSSKWGDAQWGENVVPDYVWFNGDIQHLTLNDKIDPTTPVQLNTLAGTADDPGARIWPVKTLRGKQPIDAENQTLVAAHLFGKDKNAFWKTFDWTKSVGAGMKAAGHAFSGKVGFAETEMRIPINHMVAPAEDAVQCASCHSKNGRLAKVSGVYLPGRDANSLLDFFGIALILATAFGVCGHGVVRVVMRLRAGRKS